MFKYNIDQNVFVIRDSRLVEVVIFGRKFVEYQKAMDKDEYVAAKDRYSIEHYMTMTKYPFGYTDKISYNVFDVQSNKYSYHPEDNIFLSKEDFVSRN